MPGFYQSFTSARTTIPDPAQLQAQLRALDPTAGAVPTSPDGRSFTVKKNTVWTQPQIAAAQNVIDTAPAVSPQSIAQAEIDAWPIAQKAVVLAIIDALNVIRSKLSPPLPAITPAAAVQAVRDKAATL